MTNHSQIAFILAGFVIGCGGSEKTGKVAGPPLTVGPAPLADDAYQKAGPATVAFVDLTPAGTTIKIDGCQDYVVSVAKGHANALKQDLAEGDSVVDRTVLASDLTISGTGLAVVTQITTKCAGGSFPPPTKIAASRAPDFELGERRNARASRHRRRIARRRILRSHFRSRRDSGTRA
jgi:hypothetical protein